MHKTFLFIILVLSLSSCSKKYSSGIVSDMKKEQKKISETLFRDLENCYTKVFKNDSSKYYVRFDIFESSILNKMNIVTSYKLVNEKAELKKEKTLKACLSSIEKRSNEFKSQFIQYKISYNMIASGTMHVDAIVFPYTNPSAWYDNARPMKID